MREIQFTKSNVVWCMWWCCVHEFLYVRRSMNNIRSWLKNIFWCVYIVRFRKFFYIFFLIFKSSTLTKHCVGARILKIGVFEENPKNLWKILPKSTLNRTKILPNSIRNRKNPLQNATWNTDAPKNEKKWSKKRPRCQHEPNMVPPTT